MENNPTEKVLYSGPLTGFFAQAGFGTAFTYLTSGVFLSSLAIFMGASDVLVSYISVMINICGVLILAFAGMLERFTSRKKLTIALTVLSRLFTCLIVVVPAVTTGKVQLLVFVLAVVTAFTLQAQTTVVLNQWMMGFIEEKHSGRYISLRQTLTMIVTVVLSLTGGYWMDWVEGRYIGFVVLFGIAGLMGAMEVLMLIRIPDSESYQSNLQKCSFREIVSLPLKNPCFTGFVLYIFCFYLLLNIADSFSMVYMRKYLELPYQTVTAMYLIISLPQVVLVGIWGRISDKFGHAFVLKTSIWLFAGETLFMFFVTPRSWYLFIPIAYFIASAANAGFVIAVFNRRYELMPKENRIVYDNFYTAAIGLGFILGPMIGGGIKGVIERIPAIMNGIVFGNFRWLYMISTIGILLLQVIYISSQRKQVGENAKN